MNSVSFGKTNQGGMILPMLVILVVVLILASGGSYFVLRSVGKTPQSLFPVATIVPSQTTPTPTPTPAVSESDVKRELDDIDVGSIDSDVMELNSSASSL